MMLKRWIVLFLTTVFVLAACHSPVYNQTEANVADLKIKIAAARQKSDDDAKTPPSLVVKPGLYVDTTPINLDQDPSWLDNHIVIRGDQLPFSYYSRIIANGAGSSILTKFQTGLNPAVNVSLNYSGTIRGALDLLASKVGFLYTIHSNSIYWQAFITKTFDIAFMPGGTDYLLGNKNDSGSSSSSATSSTAPGGVTVSTSDNSGDEYSTLKGSLSIWKDLDSTIKQLMSSEGKVMVSEATTSVTVRDRPTNVQLVGQYIANLNHNLTKQVLVKVQVLEVTLENDFQYGINWQTITNAFNKSPFVINGNYGTPVSITPLTSQPTINGTAIPSPQFGFNPAQSGSTNLIPSYQILLNALSQQGKTSIVTEPRVVCLNNQVSVIRIVQQQGYLASVQNTTLASNTSTTTNIGVGTVTSQLTPGNLVTGLTLYILPKILKNNIYLQVNADLSTASPFTQVSSGSATNPNSTFIQVPNFTEKHFNQRSVIHSGDTLILSGFRQLKNIANANQFINSQTLGGKGSQQVNTETIVLITPYILNGTA